MRKSMRVTGDVVRIGRGSDNEVQLPDIRVGLHAATLSDRAGGLFIRQAGDMPLRINDASYESAAVAPPDRIQIGPYALDMAVPPEGVDAALTVELIQPLGDAMQRLKAESRLALANAGARWSKRGWSWLLFLLVAIIGLAAPLVLAPLSRVATGPTAVPRPGAGQFVTLSWDTGTISNPHHFFADDCATCHRAAFASVPDSACLSCHAGIGNHFAADVDAGTARQALATMRCAACHREHRGLQGLVVTADALCESCHANLAETAPKTDVRDVTGFPSGHPDFRVTLVAEAAKPRLTRIMLGATPRPQDHPGLKFSHAAHLDPRGFLTPSGHKVMVCADCHVPDPGGKGFEPITFEGQCQSCHTLKFDAALPWREVPHGNVAAVVTAVDDFYAHIALEGGINDRSAPALVRRPVGTPLPQNAAAPRREALAWARQRAARALAIVFDDKNGCGYCHVTSRSADGGFTVAPVMLLTRFLPEAQFDHSKHAALDCSACHASRTSTMSSDVLVPGIKTCTACHGGEDASFRTRSTCISCHLFHRQEFGPMRTASVGQ